MSGWYSTIGTNGSTPSAILFVWWVVTFGVIVGNGVYWAILTPQYVHVIVSSENLHCDPFAPAETPGIRALSVMLGTYAFMNAVTVSAMYLGLSTVPFPVTTERIRLLATGHLVFGATMVVYSFVFPQAILARLVSRLKGELQDHLVEQQASLTRGQVQCASDELAAIQRQLDRVRSSRTSPLAMRAVVSYASSMVVGTAACSASGRTGSLSRDRKV